MALPKIDIPLYELTLPSTDKPISYRPFLVKEEKILLMAMEGNDQKEMTKAIKQIINNCVVTEGIEVDDLPLFDIEYILLRLRSKSMGDTIKTSYVHQECPDDENPKPIEVEIDVNTIEIIKDPTHTNKIELTDSIGIIMKYPNIGMMDKIALMNLEENTEGGTNEVIEIIAKCIDTVYEDDEIYSKSDYTPKEIKEFILNMTQDKFEKFEHFFSTIPRMHKEVEFSCKCGYVETIKLEHLNDFFG